MIDWETISLKDLAGFVSGELKKRGIDTILKLKAKSKHIIY